MTKEAKILMILTFLALTLVVYLIFSSQPATLDKVDTVSEDSSGDDSIAKDEVNRPDTEQIEEEYETTLSGILSEIETLFNNIETREVLATSSLESVDATTTQASKFESENTDKIISIRNSLLDLTVPAQFKELHFNIVMALNKMEIYLADGSMEEMFDSRDIIDKAKVYYLE